MSFVSQPIETRMMSRQDVFDQLGNDGHAMESVGEDHHGHLPGYRADGEGLVSSLVVVAPLEERTVVGFQAPSQPPGDMRGIEWYLRRQPKSRRPGLKTRARQRRLKETCILGGGRVQR